MKLWARASRIRFSLFAIWLVSGSVAQAAAPAPGLYENASRAPIVALIDSARTFIDIEIYEMSDPVVLEAITDAVDAGLRVRILQEPAPVGKACRIFEPTIELDDEACRKLKKFRTNLVEKGAIYRPFDKRLCGSATAGCVQHGKMIIVDGKAALLSTGNFNSSNLCNKAADPARCNRDYSYIIRYRPAIQTLGQIFERDLAGAPYDLKPILRKAGARDLTVSPYSIAPLASFIKSAKKHLLLQNQYLKDPLLNDAIIAAAKQGVKVRVNVADICAFGEPSEREVAKWRETYAAFAAVGIQIRVFTNRIPVGGRDGYLHSKAIVVDGKVAWMGSVNGSTQSLGTNREFGVFFDAPSDVDRLFSHMDRDFRHPAALDWEAALDCSKGRVRPAAAK